MTFLRKTAISAYITLSLATAVQARDGDLDRSFNSNGMKNFPQPNELSLPIGGDMDLALLPDGKMLLGSNVADGNSAPSDFSIVRANADGTIDPTFGVANSMTRIAFDRPFSTKEDKFSALAVQSDGKILLGGTIAGETNNGYSGDDMVIVRLKPDGKIDTSYGNAGSAIIPFDLNANGDPTDSLYSLSLQMDGKALGAGYASTTTLGKVQMAITRLTTTGIRDTGFDKDGRVTITFGGDTAVAFQGRMLTDGQHILVTGAANLAPDSTNFDFAVARLTLNGELDPQFGIGGKTTYGFDIAGEMKDIAVDFIELADGRLLVCGMVDVTGTSTDLGCMRFLATGTPDPQYSPLLIPMDLGGNMKDTLVRMKRDNQGRVLLIGDAESALNHDIVAVRLTPDGLLDMTFGKNARVSVPSFPKEEQADIGNGSKAVVVRPDGAIVIAGQIDADSQPSSLHHLQLVRLIGDTLFTDDFEKKD